MKTILCYGDSNTWGWNPATLDRYAAGERWPGVLGEALGAKYRVIEEGLPGRTTVWDDPIEGYKSGKAYLIPCLESHKPIDLVLIVLGTNDLKMRFSLSAFDIANGAGVLVDIVQRSETGPGGEAPKVLLIAPPPLGKLTDFADMFTGGAAKSRKFPEQYRRVADELGCAFMDASLVITSSDIDGVHLELRAHRKLGEAVAKRVREMLEY